MLITRALSLFIAAGATLAQGQIVSQTLSSASTRFFESAAALEHAHPSYALQAEPAKMPPAAVNSKIVPNFRSDGGLQIAEIAIDPATSLYGTGEVAGALLRNGKSITTWNTDAYGYGSDAQSLYQSHPWVLAVRPDGSAFGVLADTTYRCVVDTGKTDAGKIIFAADGPSFGVIVIEGVTPQAVLQELANLTGFMPLPPKWALGYHQCRYSYFPESRVREIAREFRDRDIPCDVIWFDIDYMEAFRVFTFDRGHFKDPKRLNADLLKDGFHNVWMIDPGMKSRKDVGPSDRKASELEAEGPEVNALRAKEIAKYEAIMQSGHDRKVWVRRADGSVYEGEVWPSWCHFPDYTRPDVRAWWAALYKDFMSFGITGVWNDMNEPAVFNVQSKTMPLDNVHDGDPSMIAPNGKPQGDRAKGSHARYHNVYGMQMIKGTREGIVEANPTKRPFVLSRANYIGGQRYGATWTGDNSATWSHMEESVPMALNVSLSGQPFIGPDIGGFAGNGDGKMFARWMGFGAMLPFARGHTGKGNIDKEPWSFGPEVEAVCREALNRRYRLMPYYYTLFREASVTGLPVVRPIFFADLQDPALRSEDDSFLLGDHLLIESQFVPDGTRAPVRPRGIWREIESADSIDLPRMFIRGGAIVPAGPTMEFVDERPMNPLVLIACLNDQGVATGVLYEDAGDGYGYQRGEFLESRYTLRRTGDRIDLTLENEKGSWKRPARGVEVRIILDSSSIVRQVSNMNTDEFSKFVMEFNKTNTNLGLELSGTAKSPVLTLKATGLDGGTVSINLPQGFNP
ncbi:MAG: TIM-barrel domain-containing protein [Phycisphaerales bacterium]